MILANPVSSSPTGGAGLAGQVAGAATGAGQMAGAPSMFALDLGAATAGMRATAGAGMAAQGFGARSGIPIAGLRQLHVDASMLAQLDVEAGLPATLPIRGWLADAARAGEGATAQPAGDPEMDGGAADTAPGVASETGTPSGPAGILSGMIAAAGQASTVLNNIAAGTDFSAALSIQAANGVSGGLPGTAQGGVAMSGSGAAGTGPAMSQPAAPGTAADGGPSNDGLRPASAGLSLSAKAAGVAAGDLALDATGGRTMQAAIGTVTTGLALPASGGVTAELPGETAQAAAGQTAGPEAGRALAGNLAVNVGATGSGGNVAMQADVAGSSEGLVKASAVTGGTTVEGTLATGAGTLVAAAGRSAGPAGAAGGTGGQHNPVAMAGDVDAATGVTGGETGVPGRAVASPGAAIPTTGAETAMRAGPAQPVRDLLAGLPGSQGAESRIATGPGIGAPSGGGQAHAATADGDTGMLPGEAPETAGATRDPAAVPARTGASAEAGTSIGATAETTVRPARDATAAGELSLSGTGPARSLAGGVIPAGGIDISVTVGAGTDGGADAGIIRVVSPERGSTVVDGQVANGQQTTGPSPAGQAVTGQTVIGQTATAQTATAQAAIAQAATGQAAKVLPRGEASAAARSSELDYAQAVEQAATGTPGQDGEGTATAREGSGKPAAGSSAQAAPQPIEIQRPGVSAAALAFAAAMAEGDAGQGEGGDPFNGLTEIARADAQASVSTAALRGSTAALPQNAAVASAHMAAEVARFVQKGQTRFQIRMDPAELGRVDVELKVSRDGTVRAHLAVERSETLDMFLRDQRGLERALDAAGLKLESGGLEMSLKNQDGSTAFDRGEGGDARSSQPGEGGVLQKEDGDTLPMAAARAYVSGASGALDIQI